MIFQVKSCCIPFPDVCWAVCHRVCAKKTVRYLQNPLVCTMLNPISAQAHELKWWFHVSRKISATCISLEGTMFEVSHAHKMRLILYSLSRTQFYLLHWLYICYICYPISYRLPHSIFPEGSGFLKPSRSRQWASAMLELLLPAAWRPEMMKKMMVINGYYIMVINGY